MAGNEDKLMNIADHLKTHCWFNYANYYTWLAGQSDISKVAEIGVWKGHAITYLAKAMLKTKKDFHLYAVDVWETWIGRPMVVPITPEAMPAFLEEVRHVYEIYNKNVQDAGVRKYITDIKMDSHSAAARFKDNELDAVYIDANHSYEYVKKDIELWRVKVRPGGVISGHDYRIEDVRKAVHELLSGIKIMRNVWYCRKG